MRRPVIFVMLAGLAAMLASVVVYSALKRRDAEVKQALAKTVHIVVASRDLPLGAKIDAGSLRLARWSSDALPEGAFSNPQQLIGSFVKSPFVRNEPIVASKLFMGQKTAGVLPLLIPAGMRAVSVPVDEVSDIAGFVLPGTHVDVLVAIAAGNGISQPFSKVVLQDVQVLAVAQEIEKRKDQPQLVKVVTLLVTPTEAERLALASREGTLRLAMRNYSDNKIVLTSGVDVHQMLDVYSSTPRLPVMPAQAAALRHAAMPVHKVNKFSVEIMRDGTKSESVSFVQAAAGPADLRPAGKTAALWNRTGTPMASAHAPGAHADSASASAAANSSAPASATFAPTPKTLDVP
jgi:pilus assembly protein CpaB